MIDDRDLRLLRGLFPPDTGRAEDRLVSKLLNEHGSQREAINSARSFVNRCDEGALSASDCIECIRKALT